MECDSLVGRVSRETGGACRPLRRSCASSAPSANADAQLEVRPAVGSAAPVCCVLREPSASAPLRPPTLTPTPSSSHYSSSDWRSASGWRRAARDEAAVQSMRDAGLKSSCCRRQRPEYWECAEEQQKRGQTAMAQQSASRPEYRSREAPLRVTRPASCVFAPPVTLQNRDKSSHLNLKTIKKFLITAP